MKYIDLFKELSAIQRTKSENLSIQMLGMVLPSSKIDDPKDMLKCLNGMRTRIEQEETKQVKTLLTAVLDMMLSDRICGEVLSSEIVFAGPFEKYRYVFNTQKKELAYLKVMDEVIDKAKSNKSRVEKDICISVTVISPEGNSEYWMTGMSDYINSKALHVKDKHWNDICITLDAPGETAFRDMYLKDQNSIGEIEIQLGSETEKPRVRIFSNGHLKVCEIEFIPNKVVISK